MLADISVAGDVFSEANRDIRAVISEGDVPVPKSDRDDPGAVIPEADVPAAVIPKTQGKK